MAQQRAAAPAGEHMQAVVRMGQQRRLVLLLLLLAALASEPVVAPHRLLPFLLARAEPCRGLPLGLRRRRRARQPRDHRERDEGPDGAVDPEEPVEAALEGAVGPVCFSFFIYVSGRSGS